MKPATTAIIACLGLFSCSAQADYDRLIQAFIGGLELDDQQSEAVDDSGAALDIEFPTLPSAGIEAEYRYGGDFLAWGVNPGGSIAWKSSGTRISGGFNGETGGTIRINIDNSLFLGEMHLGGYLRARLGQAVTVYLAAGPMVTYGKIKIEDDDIEEAAPSGTVVLQSSDSSDFGLGYYGRAGIDFSLKGEQAIGLGVRYMSTELDFGDGIGKIDLEGPQVILSYTVPL